MIIRNAAGEACLAGTDYRTKVIAMRFRAGESLDDLAYDFSGCSREALEAALRYEMGGAVTVQSWAESTALYAQDLALWGTATAVHIRTRAFDTIALDALADTLESLGVREAYWLHAAVPRLAVWFLAWNYAPWQRAQYPSRHARIWSLRIDIEWILDDSPSLRESIAWSLREWYPAARQEAAELTGLPLALFPETCPWPVEDLVRQDFWPLGGDLGDMRYIVPGGVAHPRPGDEPQPES